MMEGKKFPLIPFSGTPRGTPVKQTSTISLRQNGPSEFLDPNLFWSPVKLVRDEIFLARFVVEVDARMNP